MKPKPEITAAMELLLTRKQIERIMRRTFSGPSRVAILRDAVNRGLSEIEAELAAQIRTDQDNT